MVENRRVLIVDDNEAIHVDFRKVLCANPATSQTVDAAAAALFDDEQVDVRPLSSFEIDSAYQGQDGIDMVQRALQCGRHYAMAFVDVRMPPGLDGIETSKRLWDIDKELQIVLCTAYSDYSWPDMVRSLGETDRLLVVKKPFDNIEVRQIACALAMRWQLNRHVEQQLTDLAATVERLTAELADANRQLQEEGAERQRVAQA
jgi:two-component system, NtrC family, sensor kinase